MIWTNFHFFPFNLDKIYANNRTRFIENNNFASLIFISIRIQIDSNGFQTNLNGLHWWRWLMDWTVVTSSLYRPHSPIQHHTESAILKIKCGTTKCRSQWEFLPSAKTIADGRCRFVWLLCVLFETNHNYIYRSCRAVAVRRQERNRLASHGRHGADHKLCEFSSQKSLGRKLVLDVFRCALCCFAIVERRLARVCARALRHSVGRGRWRGEQGDSNVLIALRPS